MDTLTTNIGRYKVNHLNKNELKILKEEIFQDDIYSLNLEKRKNEEILILDVGSHIGLSVLYFKSRFPNSRIVCFEPNPVVFDILNDNIFYNNLENVQTHNVAVGKNSKPREFYIDRSKEKAFSTGSFRKNAWNGKQKSKAIMVETKPLSSFIKQKVNLVKLDVEGVELEVVKELDSSGKFGWIENMLIEYHPGKGQNIENLLSILRKNGFILEYFQDGAKLSQPKEELILVVAKKRT